MLLRINHASYVHLLSKDANEFSGLLKVLARAQTHQSFLDGSVKGYYYDKQKITSLHSITDLIKRK